MAGGPGRSVRVACALCCVALTIAASAAAGGGVGSRTLSDADYKSLLLQANTRSSAAGSAVERAIFVGAWHPHMRAALLAWADVEARLGTAFRALNPPLSVAYANAVLARGELLFASQLRAIAGRLPRDHKALGRFVQDALGNATGARMIDRGLAKLRTAGYMPPL
jgi:hypothetical protein